MSRLTKAQRLALARLNARVEGIEAEATATARKWRAQNARKARRVTKAVLDHEMARRERNR